MSQHADSPPRFPNATDATTLELELSEFLESRSQDGSPGACLIQIHPVVGRCGVQYLGNCTVIGRDQHSDFCIHLDSVSRHHAKIERLADGRYRLTDLDSTNGTFVNDVRVREWDLDPGDAVRCGGAILKILPADDLETHYHEVAFMMMTHDSLTGVHNRPFFEEAVTRELARSFRYRAPLSMLMLDLDHFKAVNDLHGHLAGDDILREFAKRVRTVIREESILARVGGEEFAVVAQEADLDRALLIAERIRSALAGRKFRITDAHVPITVSIGIAVSDGTKELSAAEFMHLADESLYAAKALGRDCVHAAAVSG